jgi:hypothetical protein
MKGRVCSGPLIGPYGLRGPMSDSGHRFGAWNETSGFALRVMLQTCPQTTFGVTSATALRTGWQQAARLNRQVVLPLPVGIDYQVPVGFAPQTGCGTMMKVAFRLPFRAAVETTLGTVPGTVPMVIRGMPIQATDATLNASSIRYLSSSWLALLHRLPSNAWPVGPRAPRTATLGVQD